MPGMPYDLGVEISFASPAASTSPAWTDVTDWVKSFRCKRGRQYETDVCEAGDLTVVLDNSDGRFDPDNTAGPHWGSIRPNRRVRIWAQQTAFSPVVYLATGYVDSWKRTWPDDGGMYSLTEVKATDRFKLLARRTNTGATVQESAAARLAAILGGIGLFSPDWSLDAGGYGSRTMVATPYNGDNTLQALNQVAKSDGGALFVDGAGVIVFQSNAYRAASPRAASPIATFGNTAGAIAVETDLDPTVDDTLMANTVTITDGAGVEYQVAVGASVAEDGELRFDLGSTLLIGSQAEDLANQVLLRRYFPRPRYDSLTIDALTGDDQLAQALNREISDRITLSLAPTGGGSTSTRDQYVESVEHTVTAGTSAAWSTTFQLSAA